MKGRILGIKSGHFWAVMSPLGVFVIHYVSALGAMPSARSGAPSGLSLASQSQAEPPATISGAVR